MILDCCCIVVKGQGVRGRMYLFMVSDIHEPGFAFSIFLGQARFMNHEPRLHCPHQYHTETASINLHSTKHFSTHLSLQFFTKFKL
jgi:hypothetical protein